MYPQASIKEIFPEIYAEGSVDKILSGHSCARAIRAHILLQQALSHLIFDELKLENDESKILLESDESLAINFTMKFVLKFKHCNK